MTVKYENKQVFNSDKPTTAEAVRRVLNSNVVYKHALEVVRDEIFTATVLPNQLLLNTNMQIELQDSGSQMTVVKINIKSQALLLGDIFGFYPRYARDFLSRLEVEVEAEHASPSPPAKVVFRKSVNWGPAIFSAAFVLLFYVLVMGSFGTSFGVLIPVLFALMLSLPELINDLVRIKKHDTAKG